MATYQTKPRKIDAESYQVRPRYTIPWLEERATRIRQILSSILADHQQQRSTFGYEQLESVSPHNKPPGCMITLLFDRSSGVSDSEGTAENFTCSYLPVGLNCSLCQTRYVAHALHLDAIPTCHQMDKKNDSVSYEEQDR